MNTENENVKSKLNKVRLYGHILCKELAIVTDKVVEGKRYKLLGCKNTRGSKIAYLIEGENKERVSFIPSEWGKFILER